MKVGTPLGEYPFEFRRLERRGGGIAVVGLVAGLESSVVLTAADFAPVAKRLGPLVGTALVASYLIARRR